MVENSTELPATLVTRRFSRLAEHRWILVLASLVLGISVVVSLWPALSAPIAGDDRYWLIETPAKFESSYLSVIAGTWEDAPAFMSAGRLTPFGTLARRLIGLAIFDFSRITATSIVTVHGLAKFLLLIAGIVSCLTFLKVLRWRSSDDRLIGAGRGSLIVVGVALVALLAAGVQAHNQFRNGWISYPPLTYSTVTLIFLSAAATVASARRVADRKRGAVPLGLLVAIGLAITLNWTYELNFLGVLLSLFALFLFPLTPKSRVKDQRRGRLLVGGPLAGLALAIFVLTRVLVSDACSGPLCYVGTTLSLGPQVFRTMFYNIASSVPGSSRAQFLLDLESLDSSYLWTNASAGGLWIISVALGASVWLIWRWVSARYQRSEDEARAESTLLAMAGASAVAVGLGGALIMSLSLQAQDLIHAIGLPYRHTVLTWSALSLAVLLFARAIELLARPLGALTTVTTFAVLVVVASAFTLPRNLVSTQAYRNAPANRAIADIHWEVITGDRNEGGDERRCQSFQSAEATINNPWLAERLEPAADKVFLDIYGIPYCSTW